MQEYKVGNIVTIREELISSSDENPERKTVDTIILKHTFNQPLKITSKCTCPFKHYKVRFCEGNTAPISRSTNDVWIPGAYLEPYEDVRISANKEDLYSILQE